MPRLRLVTDATIENWYRAS